MDNENNYFNNSDDLEIKKVNKKNKAGKEALKAFFNTFCSA